MTTYTFSTESPADVDTGLLILPVFEGGDPGPGVRETGLRDAFAAAKLTGKKGETLVVTGRDGDGFAAAAALLVGVGPKAEFDVTALRRALRLHQMMALRSRQREHVAGEIHFDAADDPRRRPRPPRWGSECAPAVPSWFFPHGTPLSAPTAAGE